MADRTEKWLAATLVHEHMHGCIETGLDRHGRAAFVGHDQARWSKGSYVNEAIATWAQREWSRDDLDMTAAIDEYLQSGPYETWPYRGAATVVRVFNDVGIGAIRSLVEQLRQVPEVAQLEFDQLVRISPAL